MQISKEVMNVAIVRDTLSKTKEMSCVYCVCITCGFRNYSGNPSNLCPRGHDDWLEYRDLFGKGHKSTVRRAQKIFNMDRKTLEERFLSGESFEKYLEGNK